MKEGNEMPKNEKLEKSIMRETILLKYEEYLNEHITECDCGKNCKQRSIEHLIKLARELKTEQILEIGFKSMFNAAVFLLKLKEEMETCKE